MTRQSAAERVRKIAEGIDGTGTADQLEALAKELETDKSNPGISSLLSALAGIAIPLCTCPRDEESGVRHIHPRTYQVIQSGEAGFGEPAKLAARIMFHKSARDSERAAMHAILDCIKPDDGKQTEADVAILSGMRSALPELVEAAEWVGGKGHDKIMALDKLVRAQEDATSAGVSGVAQRDPTDN